MIRIDRRSAARAMVVAALLPGAVAVSAGVASAGTPNKAQIEYAERRSQEVTDVGSTKARVEYSERLAEQGGSPVSGTASSSSDEFPWAIALTTLGVVAVGAGAVTATARHRHHPHPA